MKNTLHNACGIINALCFDIDDLVHGMNMKNGGNFPSEYLVESETYQLLEFLGVLQVKATMFVPGYVAERFPALVGAMADAGHHIASHGHRHIHAERLQRQGFREDITVSKQILEQIVSQHIDTYKDPCWGITPNTPWAYDELIEAGYTIDNTALPSLLKSLGRSSEDMEPFRYKGLLTVIPVTSFSLFSRSMPFNGGLFCAYIPISLQIKYYESLNRRGIPFNYFCHPYELSPQGANRYLWKRKAVAAGLYGLYFGKYRRYIEQLAVHFRFGSLKDAYESFINQSVEGCVSTFPVLVQSSLNH